MSNCQEEPASQTCRVKFDRRDKIYNGNTMLNVSLIFVIQHEPGIRNITAQIKCPPKSEVCHQKIRTAAPSRRMSTKTAPSSRTSPKPSMPLVSSSDQGKPIIFVISFLMLIFLCKRI